MSFDESYGADVVIFIFVMPTADEGIGHAHAKSRQCVGRFGNGQFIASGDSECDFNPMARRRGGKAGVIRPEAGHRALIFTDAVFYVVYFLGLFEEF